jgi:hypothetical protein
MTWPSPTPEEQVQFLRNLQRLLAEGLFVASYKFALIHALADLAVLQGDDTGAPLAISTRDIAAKFVELYWRQSRPFPGGSAATGLILQQNTGKQAAIIREIVQSQQECGGSLFRFQQAASTRWWALVAEVDQVVCKMPLWKLQTVGEERLEFLYENLDRGNRITRKPENHLAAWIERNREHQAELQERLIEAALPCDLMATVQIAKWVYQQTE